jgi:serine/threonine protein kinase
MERTIREVIATDVERDVRAASDQSKQLRDSVPMSADWPEGWEAEPGHQPASGGQGSVTKVRGLGTENIGAMKTLHVQHLGSKERRYRMQQEVALLKLFDAKGMPRVLADNMEQWQSAGSPLYAIVEWVAGPSLTQFCSGRPQSIETALTIVTGLIEIVRQCHAAGVLHRDIKPDNIILRDGNTSEPVLIDFGMGWAALNDSVVGEFETGAGQELGNRFLRLPEYAPGHHLRDTRSDVTMLVAVLFYLLTGESPRVLLDPQGRNPQEAMIERFPAHTTADPRWPRLRRVFNVGFQQRLDMRYVDTQQLAEALAALSIPNASEPRNLDAQLQRIKELAESSDGSLLEQCQRDSLAALQAFFNGLMSRIQVIGFEAGGQGPVVVEWGRAVRTTLYLSKLRAATPSVGFVHQISFENGRYEASYSVVGEAIWQRHYAGPLADPDSLREAAVDSVDKVLKTLLDRYATEFEKQVARMRPPSPARS